MNRDERDKRRLDALNRIELAKIIMDAALHKCRTIGVEVRFGITYRRTHELWPTHLYFNHDDLRQTR